MTAPDDKSPSRTFEAPGRPLPVKLLRAAVFGLPLVLCLKKLGDCLLVAATTGDAACVWGSTKATIVIGAMVAFVLGFPEWMDREYVRRVELLPDGLRAVTYHGRPIVLRWEDVTEIREFRNKAFGGHPVRLIRLTVPSTRPLLFKDQIAGYDDLVATIRRNTPQARRDGSVRFVERWLIAGKPV